MTKVFSRHSPGFLTLSDLDRGCPQNPGMTRRKTRQVRGTAAAFAGGILENFRAASASPKKRQRSSASRPLLAGVPQTHSRSSVERTCRSPSPVPARPPAAGQLRRPAHVLPALLRPVVVGARLKCHRARKVEMTPRLVGVGRRAGAEPPHAGGARAGKRGTAIEAGVVGQNRGDLGCPRRRT
jgi:hypothetical protein